MASLEGGDVRFGSKADMCSAQADVRFTPKADMCGATAHVRLVPKADIPISSQVPPPMLL